MRKMKLMLFLAGLSLFVVGCGGLNYNQVAPNAGSFHPKAVVVLPVKMPEGMETEGELMGNIVADSVTNLKRFDTVIDPSIARSQMAAAENKELSDSVTGYLSKLFITGVSDKELSTKIGAVYHVDTIFVPEIGQWHYVNYGGNKFGEVTFSLKMIDAKTGVVIWRAGHTAQEKYTFFKPNLEKMGRNLIKEVFSYIPTA